MANMDPENKQIAPLADRQARLNDFSHRDSTVPAVQTPDDIITEATPAQRERLIYLVDDALDTMEVMLHSGPPEVRIRASENVLDRAGLSRANKADKPNATLDIPAEALVEVIGGLARMFNAKMPSQGHMRNVQPIHSERSEPGAGQEPPQKPKTSLPASLIERYKEGKQ